MPTKVKELTDAAVRKLRHASVKGVIDTEGETNSGRFRKKAIGEPVLAKHAVGGIAGLNLYCAPPRNGEDIGARSWVFRTLIGGKRREIGLGAYPDVSLSKARELAREIKEQINQGIDPLAEKKTKQAQLRESQANKETFEDIALQYVQKKAVSFKESSRFKQKQKLENQLKNYVLPLIGKKLPHEIEVRDVVKVLEPIWLEKHETASRVRIHIEGVLSMAKAKAKASDAALFRDNPAKWESLKPILPEPKTIHKVQHLAALDVSDIQNFMKQIKAREGASFRMLEFIILTAVRFNEASGAQWQEMDLNRKIWRIPAERMKAGKAHSIPLSDQAIELLQSMNPKESGLIFTNSKGTALSDVSVSKIPKKLGHNVTTHGFRTTFKDWSRQPATYNHPPYDDDHTELCLAHINSSSTRAAYARDEVIEERRPIMNDWADFIAELVS